MNVSSRWPRICLGRWRELFFSHRVNLAPKHPIEVRPDILFKIAQLLSQCVHLDRGVGVLRIVRLVVSARVVVRREKRPVDCENVHELAVRAPLPVEVEEIHDAMRHVVPTPREADATAQGGVELAFVMLRAVRSEICAGGVRKLLSANLENVATSILADHGQ